MTRSNKFIKQRYDVCVFERLTGKELLILKSNFRYWFADPFLFEKKDGSFYCFVELMDNHVKRGQIAVYDSLTKKTSVVVSDRVHMSFPFIFEKEGTVYMIPETSAAKELRLYEASSFPFEWKLAKVLLRDRMVVDSVLIFRDSAVFLVLYDIASKPYCLEVYQFNWDRLEVGDFVDRVEDPEKIFRPAGGAFEVNGATIFPTQKGTKSYGEDVIFNQISLGKKTTIRASNIKVAYPSIATKYDHKHTYNETKHLAVLDFSKLVFSPIQLIDGLPCTIRRKFQKERSDD